MKTGRNEKCPCGSGKKYKNCCMNNPNGAPRKYMSEFALHTYSSKVMICYPNQLEQADVSDAAYHIYMINKIKRLSFVENSVKVFDTYVEVKVKHGVNHTATIETINLPLCNDRTYEIADDKFLDIKDEHNGCLKVGILPAYTNHSRNNLECEVLYVGQSFGRKGERDALKRLKSHETLQKILADTSYEDINYEIVITLWEFTPRLLSSMDGTKGFQVSEQEDIQHLKNVHSAPPFFIDNQIINITEGALINYFKPKYNKKLKNNFPYEGHKGYKFYYDYDYNTIVVELDPSCINIKIHSEHTDYNQFNPIKYLLDSEEKRKSMFTI